MREPFRASELTERVSITRRTEAQNAYGTLVPADSTLATVWALVRPMSGRERDRGQQTEARANYLVVIRYRSDLTEKDILTWRGTEMNIRFFRDRGPRARFLEIEAEANAPT